MKPEKSATLTGLGILTTFTVGLVATLLLPSFNQNWSANTALDETQFHATYISHNGHLMRQWPDGSTEDYGATAVPEGTTVGYTDQEELGRRVYQREGCMYCHSQQIRPLDGEMRRYTVGSSLAIPADAREYVYDQPHFLGTRRIGPDLSREGGKYSNDWQLSHFWNPRQMVVGSVMPAFTWLFTTDAVGDPKPTKDALALTAYVQTLGFGRLIHRPDIYKTHGGWGPWLRPSDQQGSQDLGESQVVRAQMPVRSGTPTSASNRVTTPSVK